MNLELAIETLKHDLADVVAEIWPTGSRVYGKPREEWKGKRPPSDWDLITFVTDRFYEAICELHDSNWSFGGSFWEALWENHGPIEDQDFVSMRNYQNINAIVIQCPHKFDSMMAARDYLTERAPVDRDFSVKIHKQFYEEMRNGISHHGMPTL